MNVSSFSSSPSSNTTSSLWGLRESRRIASRRAIVLPCQAVREHDFKLVADRTLDVSAEGLLLPLRERILTGDSLIVSFQIPGMWIDAEATVARVIHGRRPADDGLAIGVMFDRLAPSARAALAGFLHGYRAPLPRRGPLSRLRRGGEPPRLADEDLMHPPLRRVDASNQRTRHEDVDGLGVLRAVVGAWRNLTIENDATNAD